MRVYLDTCCLNRPFDPSREQRVHLEAEAVMSVLARIFAGKWTWVGSDVLDVEINATPNRQVRAALRAQLRRVSVAVPLTEAEVSRATALAVYGIKTADARHLACAEAGNAEVLFTTDDKLVRAARRAGSALRVAVINPREYIERNPEP